MLGILLTVLIATPMPAPTEPMNGCEPALKQTLNAPEARQQLLVKLRKLHLVRPDLISYPVATETYC